MANITYVTTVRMGGSNSPNVSVISFLERKSSSGNFSELSNSRVGTSIVKTSQHKSSYTGSYIVQLNAGDQLKVTARRTGGSSSAELYVTSQDTSISIFDLLGGGSTGHQGDTGEVGAQ